MTSPQDQAQAQSQTPTSVSVPLSNPPPTTSTSTTTSASPLPQSVAAAGPSISHTPPTPIPAVESTLPTPATAQTSSAMPTTTSVSATTPVPINEKSTATPAASSSKPSALPSSTAKPTASAMKPTEQKKKRRRKGFAGFLLSMGCLSASEFEEDPKEVRKREAANAKLAGGSSKSEVKPATAAVPVVKEKQAEGGKVENGTATGKTAVGAGAAAGVVAGAGAAALAGGKREKEEVVVPSAEPFSPPLDETAGMTSSAVQPPGSGSELLQTTPSRPTAVTRESDTGTTSPEHTSSGGYTEMLQTEGTDSQGRDENGEHEEADGDIEYGDQEEYEDEEDRLIAQGGIGIPVDEHGRPAPLLPPISKEHTGRKCLVLDLDETLLHSSFKMLPSADYIVPVEIESQTHNVYVIKRPGVDHFLTEMGKIYEVVVFTASLSKYADPVLDMLDPDGVVKHRLFRESCYNHKGNYVKDLSQLGRTMETCIILDNSPASYIFHPNNAVPVSTWFNDPHDTELTDLCPFLTDLATVDDIRGVLDGTL